jgi:hypothetical protein
MGISGRSLLTAEHSCVRFRVPLLVNTCIIVPDVA